MGRIDDSEYKSYAKPEAPAEDVANEDNVEKK